MAGVSLGRHFPNFRLRRLVWIEVTVEDNPCRLFDAMAANDQQAECWHLVSQTPYPDGALPDEDPGLEMTKLLCPAYLK